MYTVRFKEVYSERERSFQMDSPEIRFLKSICCGETDAKEFFNEETLYGSQVFLDAPNGRFDGVEQIQEFSENWLDDFEAISGAVYPVIQTRANGRAATEAEVEFKLKNGEVQSVPMVIIGDLAGEDKLEGVRIYFFYLFLPGCKGYRKAIFRPNVNDHCEYALLTGAVRAYYEALNDYNSERAFTNIMNSVSDDILYGGFRPEEVEPLFKGKELVGEVYKNFICRDWPKFGFIRFETITDDGVNCIVEWTVVLTKEGLKEGNVCFAGCASYERDSDGKLYSIRICDNNGCDIGVDPRTIPQDLWFIEGK